MAKKTAQISLTDYQALIAGIQKYAPNAIFQVASQTLTAAQAVAFLQTLHDSSAARIAAKAALAQAIHADQTLEAQNGLVARDIRDTVALMFSNAPATLAAFNLSMRKPPRPLTTEALAARSAKARATRAARGTKGKLQKAAIVGNVTGVTITPVVTPTTPTPATTPTAPTTTTNGATPVAPAAAANGTTHA